MAVVGPGWWSPGRSDIVLGRIDGGDSGGFLIKYSFKRNFCLV